LAEEANKIISRLLVLIKNERIIRRSKKIANDVSSIVSEEHSNVGIFLKLNCSVLYFKENSVIKNKITILVEQMNKI